MMFYKANEFGYSVFLANTKTKPILKEFKPKLNPMSLFSISESLLPLGERSKVSIDLP